MITVTIVTNKEGELDTLIVNGHAQASKQEHSLVCAGVSSVVTGGFNSLDTEHCDFVLESGNAVLTIKKPLTPFLKGSIHTILVSLETLAESFKDFIKIVKITAKEKK